MRDRGSPDGVVEVEIVEVTGHDDLTGTRPGGNEEALDEAVLHPARRRVLRWLGIGVVAGLAVGVVTVNLAEARHDAARREALAGLPWVMPPMDGPLEEVWRTPGGSVLAETDELVVVAESMGIGSMRGIDVRTGDVRWERPGANEYCEPVQEWMTQGAVLGPALSHPDVLMCIPYDAAGSDGTPPAEGATIPVTFVDLDTGEVPGRVTIDGQVINYAEVDGDMIFASVRAEGAVGVVRVDPLSGDIAWTWTSGPGVLPDGSFGDWSWDLDEDTGVLQIEGARAIAVSVETGVEVEPGSSFRNRRFATLLELASGQVVEVAYDPERGTESTRVLEPDGTTRFELDGSLWWNWFDDGSVPDALVIQRADVAGATQDVTLVSVDLVTGEERWSVVDEYSYPVFVLDGIAVTTGPTTSALDMRTGRWLWMGAGTPGMASFSPLTDGEVVLVPVADGGTALAALDLRTGEERWRMLAPGAFADPQVIAGTLLLTTGYEVVAYR